MAKLKQKHLNKKCVFEHSQPIGSNWGHQCSWTQITAKELRSTTCSLLTGTESHQTQSQVLSYFAQMGGAIRWQHILVSCFTCTTQGDLVQLLSPTIIAQVGSAPYDAASCPAIVRHNPPYRSGKNQSTRRKSHCRDTP